jgi:tetratricopeptide (TPR) repeat protein
MVIVVAPQLLGGVYPWGMLLISGGALCALGLALWASQRSGVRWAPLVAAMLIALLWTMVQATPLPCAFVEHIAPKAAAEVQRAYRVLGSVPPTWCALSQDPGGTREEVVKGIGITASFVCAWILARRGYSRAIYRAVAASGTLLAAVALAHAAVGATSVFGLYEPIEIRAQPFLAPLMNLNTLGGFLAMCVPILISLAFSEGATARERLLLQLCTGLVACAIFMTRSRGAVGALFLGVGLFVFCAWLNRRLRAAHESRAPRAHYDQLAAVLVIASALAVVVYGGYSEIVPEFRGGGWEKLELIDRVLHFAARQPVIGVGRGAFGSAFAPEHNTSNRFEYAEDFVAQWVTEWGAPVALLLIGAIAHAMVQAVRRGRSIERMGALAGLLALAAQNLVDIGLELIGVAIVASALLAACTASAISTRERKRARGSRLPLAGFTLCVALLLALARPIYTDHATYLREQLAERFEARDREGFRASLVRAVAAHPSDAPCAVLAASEALLHADPAAGGWINRAMQLAPGWSAPHELAARWLWRGGRVDQARIELAAAMSRDPYATRGLACSMAKTDPVAVAHVIPPGPHRRLLFEFLAQCIGTESEAAAQIDAIIVGEFPDDPNVALRNVQRHLARGEAQAAYDMAEAALRRAPNLAVDASLLQVRALRALGRDDEAVAALQRAQKAAPDSTKLVAEEAQLQADRGDRAGTQAALARLRGLSAARAGDTANAFMLEATLERKLGNLPGSLRAYDQAYGITGEYAALSGIASTAEELGDRQRAVWAYGMMCGMGATARDACARRDRLLTRPTVEFPSKAAQPSQR